MSNGRRRWRKLARKRTHRENQGTRTIDPTVAGFKPLRYSRGNFMRRHVIDRPAPLPPRPWSPRSLVGMTQGARKRALRSADHEVHRTECFQGTVAPYRGRARVQKFCVPRCPRAQYRIGERLRPCPWCSPSREPSSDCAGAAGWVDAIARDLDPPPTCNGSGLVPARKAKR